MGPASACLLIASKFENANAPTINDLLKSSTLQYKAHDVREAEVKVLQTLQYLVSSASPIVFFRRLPVADEYHVLSGALATPASPVTSRRPHFDPLPHLRACGFGCFRRQGVDWCQGMDQRTRSSFRIRGARSSECVRVLKQSWGDE